MEQVKQSWAVNLRFSSKTQLHEAKKLAKKHNQSLNGFLLALIDGEREFNKSWLKKDRMELSKQVKQ